MCQQLSRSKYYFLQFTQRNHQRREKEKQTHRVQTTEIKTTEYRGRHSDVRMTRELRNDDAADYVMTHLSGMILENWNGLHSFKENGMIIEFVCAAVDCVIFNTNKYRLRRRVCFGVAVFVYRIPSMPNISADRLSMAASRSRSAVRL